LLKNNRLLFGNHLAIVIMNHPFFTSFKNTLNYILAWALVTLVHAFVLWQLYNLEWSIVLVDSLVTYTMFGIMGLAVWFPIMYINIENKSVPELIIEHIAVAFILVALWFYFSDNLLRYIFKNDAYNAILDTFIGWRLFIGLLLYFNITLTYYVIVYYENFKEKIIGEAKLQSLIKEAELNYLKAQINPHFLFNSLNSVSSLTVSDPEKASEMITKLSEYLRYSLAAGKREISPFFNELNNVEAYLDIEKIRFGRKLNFNPQVDAECMQGKIPALILQPIIENAVKHGVSESLVPVEIKLDCRKFNNLLDISISNTYDPGAPLNKGTGLGIDSVKNRLLLIYDRDDLVRISKKNNEFNVRIFIPQ